MFALSACRSLAVVLVVCGLVAVAGCGRRSSRAAAPAGPVVEYVVQPGDTLSSVSAAYGITIDELISTNRLRRRTLAPGSILLVPGYDGPVTPPAPPVVQRPIAPPPPTAKDNYWYVPRRTWTDQSVDLSNIDPMMKPIYRITIHHSGEYGDATAEPRPMLRLIEKVHMRDRGWACIGYHFIIDREGTVYEGRPVKYQGAHAGGDNNIGNIGVSLLGDFNQERVPATQAKALAFVLERLTTDYAIKRSNVFGHQHFKITDCPGKNLEAWLQAWKAK